MRKSHAFRPTGLDTLESRLVLSTASQFGGLFSKGVIDTARRAGVAVDKGAAHFDHVVKAEMGMHAAATHAHAAHHHHHGKAR